ncbi:hypothetical protein ACFQ08_15655 [Streptosporangium algeriense]|uniref:Transposase n=1 Tax=Streptosporangium algeriense TaxID=1682748 RepID=A0ABW3DT68_9ACTN
MVIGWEIEAESKRIDDGDCFVREIPTGRVRGRCGCGHRVEGPDGEALPSVEVYERLGGHIATDHPDWPDEARL